MRYLSLIALLLVGCNQVDNCRLESFRSMLSETGVKLTEAQSASVVILHENTAALQKIADSVDSIAQDTKQTKEVVESIASQEAVQVESETDCGKEVISSVSTPSEVKETPASGGVRLQFWSTASCIYCPAAKKTAQAAADELGIELEPIDGDKCKDQMEKCKVSRFPTLCIVYKGMTRKWLVGKHSKKQILDAVEAVRAEKYATVQGAVEPPVQMSHAEMVALHNSLHGPGSWNWPGDLAEHLRDVHGIDTGSAMASTQPVYRSYPMSRTWTLFNWVPSRRGR